MAQPFKLAPRWWVWSRCAKTRPVQGRNNYERDGDLGNSFPRDDSLTNIPVMTGH
jgi:hypothetical protein